MACAMPRIPPPPRARTRGSPSRRCSIPAATHILTLALLSATAAQASKLYGSYAPLSSLPPDCASALSKDVSCSSSVVTADSVPFAAQLVGAAGYVDLNDTSFLSSYCKSECRDDLDALRKDVQDKCGEDTAYGSVVDGGDAGFGDVKGEMKNTPGYVAAGAVWGWDIICLEDDLDSSGEQVGTHFCLAEELSKAGNLPCSNCSLSYKAALAEFPPPQVTNPDDLAGAFTSALDGCVIPLQNQTSWFEGELYTGYNVYTEPAGASATRAAYGTGIVTATAGGAEETGEGNDESGASRFGRWGWTRLLVGLGAVVNLLL